ncbi:right-handed parallel beta-helix repeat-containing protein [Candidatus Bipolaricaulota sp. J31]
MGHGAFPIRGRLWVAVAIGLVVLIGSGPVRGQGQPEVDYWVPGDFPTVQEAIDSVPPGSAIGIREGIYEEHLVIEKPLSLIGAGPGKTVIQAVEEGKPVIRIRGETPVEVVLRGLTLRGAFGRRPSIMAARGVYPDGLLIQGRASVTLEGIEAIENSGFGLEVMDEAQVSVTDSQISANGVGILMFDSSRVTVKACRILSNGDGIQLREDSQATVEDADISGNKRWGIYVEGKSPASKLEVRRSRIVDNYLCGIGVAGNRSEVSGADNEMHGNGADLCGYAPPGLRKPLVPQTGRSELRVPGDYATVQEAIDAVAPGGTIFLAEGTYQEGLTLWKPLTLVGAGRDRTILRALPDRQLVVSIPAGVKVRLESLQVTGSKNGKGLEITGQAELVDLSVTGNSWHGLVIWSRERWDAVPQVILRNSQVSGNAQIGVYVGTSSWVLLRDTTVSHNARDGLLLIYGAQITVEASRILDNGSSGISVQHGSSATVKDSVIEGNGRDIKCGQALLCNGITVLGQARVEVTGCVIRANAGWGISAALQKCGFNRDFFQGEVILRDNEITGNGRGDVCLPDHCIPEDACG